MSRLAEIKSNIEYNRFGSKIVLTESEYNYLIQQAERVEDLEDKLARIRFVNSFYDKINIRYRKALNNIIRLWIASTWIASTDATDDTWLAHKMSEIAIKALEGEDYNE